MAMFNSYVKLPEGKSYDKISQNRISSTIVQGGPGRCCPHPIKGSAFFLSQIQSYSSQKKTHRKIQNKDLVGYTNIQIIVVYNTNNSDYIWLYDGIIYRT